MQNDSRSVSRAATCAAAVAVLALGAMPASAQDRTSDQLDRDRYHRAERFLGWHANDLVAGGSVSPVWLDDGARFWYRNNTGNGYAFILVDPVRNTQGRAFDHDRLASAMSLAADTSFIARKLPFQTFEFADGGQAIEFNARNRRFHCTVTDYTCSIRDTLPDRDRYVVSPDSAWEVFYSGYNLWIRPHGETDSTQLTVDGEKYWSYGASEPRPTQLLRSEGDPDPPTPDIVWSPDSRKLIVERSDERDVAHHHYVSYTSTRPRHFSQPYALPGDSIVPVPNLHIIDIETKENIALNLEPVANQIRMEGAPIDSVWSDDGSVFRFHYLTRGSKSMYLIEADAETGATRVLARDTAATWVETNPRGQPSWTVTDDGDVIWWSERDGWPHLWRFDATAGMTTDIATENMQLSGPSADADAAPAAGMTRSDNDAFWIAPPTVAADPEPVNQITRGAWATGDVHFVDEPTDRIYFTARGREDGRNIYYAHLYRVNFDGTGLTLLTPEPADHDIEFSPDGRFIVDTYSTIKTPPVTVLRSTTDGRIIQTLEEADISRLEEIGWTPPQVFKVKARDGVTDIYGTMYLPTDFDSTRSYPIIDHIYPGPQVGSVGQWRWTTGGEERAIAELGFVVVEIDHMGTPLRSKAFHDNYYGFFGDNGLPDHITAIKQLAARYDFIDIDRVGIYGHSGGGFASTDAMLRHPDFFKVAVSGAGNHDNRSYNIYWAEKYQGLLTRDSVSGKDNFESSANQTMAANLKGRLLLMHGDMDDNVHPAMTIQVVNELIKANKDFDLIWAPDRAHGLNEPYFVRRRWDYFVRHLLGVEPPAEYEIRRPTN